jgi:hypothetical protein
VPEENPPPEEGISNRQLSTTFIPPLTAKLTLRLISQEKEQKYFRCAS